jgi:quercetin 2,3-dioxygenase
MSAGTGISHSEYNASKTEPVHFLQIWITPDETGLQPGYEQRSFDLRKKSGSRVLVAAPDARDGAVKLHQDAELWLSHLTKGAELAFPLKARRRAWLQIVRGQVNLDGASLTAGDGAGIHDDEGVLAVKATEPSEILLFDLA